MNARALFAIFSVLCLFSCKKNSDSDVSSTQIKLDPLSISGNLVILKWSKLNSSNLQYYEIIKMIDTTVPSSATVIKVDKNATEYTDTLSTVPYIRYSVAGISAVSSIESNTQLYVCSSVSFMNIFPADALYDRGAKRLYIYDARGNIILYNLQTGSVVKQISTDTKIGYCDIGSYNGQKELYVPRNDGWIFIYDGNSLSQIDQIYTGIGGVSVAYNNGILYINGYSISSDSSYVASYSLATKSLISRANTNLGARMKFIPGTNSEFIGLSTGYLLPWYFKFDTSGDYVSDTSDMDGYLNDGYNDFEILPGGNDFIAPASGNIFNKNLQFLISLPSGDNLLTEFAVDSLDHLVYAGTNGKIIKVYSLGTYLQTDSIQAQGYPMKIFFDNGSLICVSSISAFVPAESKNDIIFVEQH